MTTSSTACASASTSNGSTRRPARSVTTSGKPPTRYANTGTPALSASSAATPKLSLSLGSRNASACFRYSTKSARLPRKHTLFVRPRSRARCAAWVRSGPSPTSTSRAGMCRRTRTSTSIRSATRLTARKFDTWKRIGPSPSVTSLADGSEELVEAPSIAAVGGREVIGVDEVRDHLDRRVVGQAEEPVRLAPQELGRHRDAVRRRDGEARDRLRARIATDPRHVGAVQRGHDPRRRSAEHLPREIRARSVRNRVVDVHQIEAMVVRDVDDRRGHRQGVRRMLEQRIVGNGDLVEQQAFTRGQRAARRRAGDDVDAMPAPREPDGKLGGDDSAAAEARVADDADRQCGAQRGASTARAAEDGAVMIRTRADLWSVDRTERPRRARVRSPACSP